MDLSRLVAMSTQHRSSLRRDTIRLRKSNGSWRQPLGEGKGQTNRHFAGSIQKQGPPLPAHRSGGQRRFHEKTRFPFQALRARGQSQCKSIARHGSPQTSVRSIVLSWFGWCQCQPPPRLTFRSRTLQRSWPEPLMGFGASRLSRRRRPNLWRPGSLTPEEDPA
jgi:hypothetical protein